MTDQDFENFVDAQQSVHDDTVLDVEKQINEWRSHLEDLYSKTEEYMGQYIDTGRATLEFKETQLNEEFSGPYTVREMALHIGRSAILFKPIGTMLIGAKGRVDVQGPRGVARLILVNKKVSYARDLIRVTATVLSPGDTLHPAPRPQKVEVVEWAWKISTPPPEMRFIELTKDDFFQMVLAIANA